MNITILSYGSRGDVQPFVALALGLRAAGHAVTLAAPEDFEAFVRGFGLDYAPLTGHMREMLEGEEGRQCLAAGNVVSIMRAMTAAMALRRDDLALAIGRACEGADLVVATALTLGPGACLAEKVGAKLAIALTFPITMPTRAFPDPFVHPRPLPLGRLNLFTHQVTRRLYWRALGPDVVALRKTLGLPALSGDLTDYLHARRVPCLHVCSPHLLPPVADWPAGHGVTGALVLPAGSRAGIQEGIPPALTAWLDDGPAPIFFGFGSMPVLDPRAMAAMAAAAGARLGQRVLIGAGWSRYDSDLPAHVRLVEACDHEALFQRCAAVVHHGGAGTTATAVRAGAPALVCSVFGDQPFWGERLRALGVGAHLRFRDVTVERLVGQLGPLLTPAVRARAEALAQRVRGEDGVAVAVAQLEALAP